MKKRQERQKLIIAGVIVFILGFVALGIFHVVFGEKVVLDTRLTDEYRLGREDDPSLIGPNVNTIKLTPKKIEVSHSLSVDNCPNIFDELLQITGPRDGSWLIDQKSIPEWLTVPVISGDLPGEMTGMSFNCILNQEIPQTLTAQLNIQARNDVGQAVDQTFFDIELEIIE